MSKKTSPLSPYKLSEGSKITSIEFTEASKTAALFYQRFKQIMGQSWERGRLIKFRRGILQIIRTGPEELIGQRRLWDGNFNQLSGYELNPQVSVDNIFPVSILAAIAPLHEVQFKIPPFKYGDTFKHHKDAACAELKIYVFAFNLVDKTFSGKSILAFNLQRNDDLLAELNINLPIPEVDDRLLVLVKHVYFKREEAKAFSVIKNMRYIAAQIMSIAYIKEGALVSFTPEKKPNSIMPEEKQGVWVDID